MAWSAARACILGLIVGAGCLSALAAEARVDASPGYTKAQTYSGALRYLRVDLGYEVVERDPDAAYLIFRYAPPGQSKTSATGTLEVVETEGRVRLFVSLPRMPEYHERVFRDGLLRKLKEEYGAPPAPRKPDKPPPPPASQPDAGADPDAG